MNLVQFLADVLGRSRFWFVVAPWELALRVRFGSRVRTLGGGFHFKVPFFDVVFVQATSLRTANLPVQTVMTRDGRALTLSGAVGYRVVDIAALYRSLKSPEDTIANVALGVFATVARGVDSSDFHVDQVEAAVLEKLSTPDWGIRFEFVRVTDFAFVRTYRFITDTKWGADRIRLDERVH